MPAEKASLYERLGGVYSIATVVDDFIDRIMVDSSLNANPLVDEAHHRVPPGGVQGLGDRDGLLGRRRPAKIHGQVDEGLACALEDHQQGMGGILRRFSADS